MQMAISFAYKMNSGDPSVPAGVVFLAADDSIRHESRACHVPGTAPPTAAARQRWPQGPCRAALWAARQGPATPQCKHNTRLNSDQKSPITPKTPATNPPTHHQTCHESTTQPPSHHIPTDTHTNSPNTSYRFLTHQHELQRNKAVHTTTKNHPHRKPIQTTPIRSNPLF